MRPIRKRTSVVVVSDAGVLGFRAEDPYNQKRYIFLPGGLIEKDETIEHAAERETYEETGYRITTIPSWRRLELYNFYWNGVTHHCETWFLAGQLSPALQNPQPVSDASYHRGVVWVPREDVSTVFAYHPAILGPIEEFLSQAL